MCLKIKILDFRFDIIEGIEMIELNAVYLSPIVPIIKDETGIKRGANNMSFYIQANNPKIQHIVDFNDESLADAIESAFCANTENAILMWNYISIPLSYKYDISYMVEDILRILSALKEQKSGKMIIHWLPDTFRCDWRLYWDMGRLQIESQWECIVGELEKLLNEKSNLILQIEDFISEWKEILYIVIKGLECCGYDKNKIAGMQKLAEMYESIEESGILYRS